MDRHHCNLSDILVEIDDIALLVTVETGRDPSPSSCSVSTAIDMEIHSHDLMDPPHMTS